MIDYEKGMKSAFRTNFEDATICGGRLAVEENGAAKAICWLMAFRFSSPTM
jgi:hypothetical protein